MNKEVCERCEVAKCRMFNTKDEETGQEFLRVLAGDYFKTKRNIPNNVDKAQYLMWWESFLDVKLEQALEMDGCEMIWKDGKMFMFKDKGINGLHLGRKDEWKFEDMVPEKSDSKGCPYYTEHLMHSLNKDGK
jgi:hypothetical protein